MAGRPNLESLWDGARIILHPVPTRRGGGWVSRLDSFHWHITLQPECGEDARVGGKERGGRGGGAPGLVLSMRVKRLCRPQSRLALLPRSCESRNVLTCWRLASLCGATRVVAGRFWRSGRESGCEERGHGWACLSRSCLQTAELVPGEETRRRGGRRRGGGEVDVSRDQEQN